MANYREITGLSVASLNGFLLSLTDVSSFKWISIHSIGQSFQGTIQYQGGNDITGVSTKNITLYDHTLTTQTSSSVNAVNVLHHGPLFFHYFQAQCTAYTSGTLTAIVELWETPPTFLTSLPLNTGTNTIGNTGVLALPTGATQQNANGTATAGTATATLTGVGGKNTYLTGIEITVIDTATAGSAELSITGVIGGPLAYEINVQGTVGVEAPIIIPFTMPLQSSAVNTNIVVSLPSLGASTGKVSVVAHGYTL